MQRDISSTLAHIRARDPPMANRGPWHRCKCRNFKLFLFYYLLIHLLHIFAFYCNGWDKKFIGPDCGAVNGTRDGDGGREKATTK